VPPVPQVNLFGEDVDPPAPITKERPAVAVDLFTAAAERLAMTSGRPASQERLELAGHVTPAAGALELF
jgi:hypothetical protein